MRSVIRETDLEWIHTKLGLNDITNNDKMLGNKVYKKLHAAKIN